ncbi:uncharacterized protein LOC134258383 [Saccostrea cucullata]|uniref:uncharacterized protein LOC134258383 n=1 Tax=Saccostrea cuccullata TaxID=36930 RepID=UPI002ED263F7
MSAWKYLSIVFVYHVVSGHMGRDHSGASRWYQRTVKIKDPFDKFTEESLALGHQLTLPKPGESGFSGSDAILPPTTVPPTLDPFLNYDYGFDYPSVTPSTSTTDKSGKTTAKTSQTSQVDSMVQNLEFINPVQGDTFSVTFNPLPTLIYPSQPGDFLNLERTKLYPESYENKHNLGTFKDSKSNTLHNDIDFFAKLKNERKRILAERLVRNIEKPLDFGAKNNFVDPLWLYLLASQ